MIFTPLASAEFCDRKKRGQKPVNACRSLGILPMGILDEDYIARMAALAERQLLAIRRPIEAEQSDSSKLSYLVRDSFFHSLAPNIVAVFFASDVGQFTAIWTPPWPSCQ